MSTPTPILIIYHERVMGLINFCNTLGRGVGGFFSSPLNAISTVIGIQSWECEYLARVHNNREQNARTPHSP